MFAPAVTPASAGWPAQAPEARFPDPDLEPELRGAGTGISLEIAAPPPLAPRALRLIPPNLGPKPHKSHLTFRKFVRWSSRLGRIRSRQGGLR